MNAPVMNIGDILRYLPHRYPFLLVDRVVELDRGKSIKAYKNITFNEEFFQGHFPGKPVMPGVLILEALAQTGGLMIVSGMSDEELENKLFLFTSVEKAKFRAQVVPGDRLDLECRLIRQKLRLWKIETIARVDGVLAAEAELSAAIVDIKD